jgi:hypothetical protein
VLPGIGASSGSIFPSRAIQLLGGQQERSRLPNSPLILSVALTIEPQTAARVCCGLGGCRNFIWMISSPAAGSFQMAAPAFRSTATSSDKLQPRGTTQFAKKRPFPGRIRF